jgi:hypothetical protein
VRKEMKRILRIGMLSGFSLMAFLLGLTFLWTFQAEAEENPKLAVLPFFIERPKGIEKGVVCPFCKGIYRGGEVVPGAQNTLMRLLYQKMEGLRTFNLLPLEKVEEAFLKFDKRLFQENPLSSSLQIGKELEVDYLFTGFLFRFEERIGSSLGVDRPASVGFDLHLYRLKDGVEVWRGKFNETQRPLSENLFKIGSFIRRKAHWLTAEELSSVGMDEILSRLPSAQELEEKR